MDKINADSDCGTAQKNREPENMYRNGIDQNDIQSFSSP